jgi:cell division protein FtsQ
MVAARRKNKLSNINRELKRGRKKKKKRAYGILLVRAGLVLLMVIVSSLIWTCMPSMSTYIRQQLTEQEIGTIKEVVVQGNYHTAKEGIVQQLDLEPGMLLFDVDLVEKQVAVEDLPYVKTAQLSRQWPDRLLVSVTERVPVAIVNLEKLYYVDADGQIFKRIDPGEEVDLPVITGLSVSQLQKNPDQGRTLLDSGLKLLACWQENDAFRQEGIAEIHLDDAFGLTVFTRRHIWQLRLGLDEFRLKLKHWQKVLAYLGKEAEQISSFDCSAGHSVVVRYGAAGH